MKRSVTFSSLLCAALLAVALAVAGCGGGGGETTASTAPTTSATPTTTQTSTTAKQGHKAKGDSKSAKQQGKSGSSAKPENPAAKVPASSAEHSGGKVVVPPISSARVPGSKAAAPGVTTTKGGDNSVQTYGTESDRSQLVDAATTVQAYLNARLAKQWATACAYLTEEVRSGLEQLAAKAQKAGKDISGCAGAMGALYSKAPEWALRKSATIDKVLSFRSGGDLGASQAFLLFLGPPDSTLYSVPMRNEGGQWKVGAQIPVRLPV